MKSEHKDPGTIQRTYNREDEGVKWCYDKECHFEARLSYLAVCKPAMLHYRERLSISFQLFRIKFNPVLKNTAQE
jgi:hypothetical protein